MVSLGCLAVAVWSTVLGRIQKPFVGAVVGAVLVSDVCQEPWERVGQSPLHDPHLPLVATWWPVADLQ